MVSLDNMAQFLVELSQFKPNAQFIVVHKYRNTFNELSDFNLLFHISYENALEKSLQVVEELKPRGRLERIAREELIESYKNSLLRCRSTLAIEEQDKTYLHFRNSNGTLLKGCKLHRQTGILHLFGLIHQKRILEVGQYKEVVHSPLTEKKNEIRQLCPVDRFRQFKLLPARVERIKIAGINLLPPGPLF